MFGIHSHRNDYFYANSLDVYYYSLFRYFALKKHSLFSVTSRKTLDGLLSTIRFTETRAYKALLKKLEQQNHALVLGRPGDGKTTLCFKALDALHKTHNCDPFLDCPSNLDFLSQIGDKQKVAIFLDDLFGIYSVSGEYMSRALVYQVLNLIGKESFLIMAMRKEIYLQCRNHLPNELFSSDAILDLTMSDYEFLEQEKLSMLQSVLDLDEDVLRIILNHERFSGKQIGFPQCVALMKGSRGSDFQNILETPLNYLTKQLVFLYESCRAKYMTLVMAFSNDGRISQDDIEKLRCHLPNDIDDSSVDTRQIKQAIKSIDGTYYRFDVHNDQYIVNHETIMEALGQTLWDDLGLRNYFIKTCPKRFLTRLSTSVSNTYFLSKRHYNALFERLECLLQSGHETSFGAVANVDLWKNCDAANDFVDYIKSQHQAHSDINGTHLLVFAAIHGRINLVKSLLEKDVQDKDQMRIALYKAAEYCHVNVANYLLSSCALAVDIDLVFYGIKGKSLDMYQLILSHTQCIDYSTQRESMVCMFFAGNDTIEVNILEEIILSGNLNLFQHVMESEKIDVCRLVSENPRITEFAAYSGSIDLMQCILNSGGKQCPHLLWWAANSGSIDMITFLINKGCRFNQQGHVSCDSDVNSLKNLHGSNEMHSACMSGNKDIVLHLFQQHPEFINMKDSDDCTPALLSPFSGSLDIVKYMDDKGDLTSVSKNGYNVLHFAAWQGQLDILRYLTERFPDLLKNKNNRGKHPIILIGMSGSVEAVEYMISNNCNILDIDNNGRIILHDACRGDKLTLVKHLVENYPALLTMRDDEGLTPLHHAGLSGSVELVNYLIRQQHCDVLDKSNSGRTILHYACQEGKLTLVKHLVENYPALLTMRGNEGLTSLHTAGWSNSVELVDNLVRKQHCDVLDKSNSGRTVLHNACQGGKLTLVKHLVENYPALLTMRDNKGLTPLHTAGWSNSVELVDNLVRKQHCDVLDKDSVGRTVLHNACEGGKLTLVKHLVEHYPALLTMRDNKGLAPLHTTGWSNSVELVDNLVRQQHCDVLDKDSVGRTVLHYACQGGKLTLVKHLVENYPALLAMRDNKGLTPLHTAGWSGSVELVDYLVHHQHCAVLDKDSGDRTIVHNACQGGKLTLVKHLVENYPALLTMRDNEGLTPLHTAGWSNSVELVNYLVHHQYCAVLDKDSCGRTILHNACQGGKLTLVKHLVENYPALLTMRDNEGVTPLHRAGYSDSVELVNYLIRQQHCDVLDKDSDGWTILHIACQKGKLTLVKHLVENYPALLTMRTNDGQTPLHMAGFVGSIEVIDYFASQKCSVLDTDRQGWTILHHACCGAKLTLVKHLVENYPALLTIRDNNGRTPLHMAGSVGSVEVVDYFASQKCNMLDTDSNGWTTLHNAFINENLTLVKHLVENYPALPTMRDIKGQIPLQIAGCVDSFEVIEYLTSQKIDMLDADSNGRTILHTACMNENLTLVKHLVENHPALLTMRDSNGRTPLQIAGCVDSFEVIEYLTSQKIDMLDADSNGRTILHTACMNENLTLVKHLVENHPALLTMRDSNGRTPLQIAGCVDSFEVIEYLTSQKIDMLDADSNGRTILHTACMNENLTLVKHLVENHPALLTMRDNNGRTPLQIAGSVGSVEVIDYFARKKCNMLDTDSNGRTILHKACMNENLTLVKHLVENYPALLTIRDNNRWTPLHMAVLRNSIEVIDYFGSQEFDMLVTDSDGRTILQFACMGGKLTLVKHLVENYPALLTIRDKKGQTPLHIAGFVDSVEVIDYFVSQKCSVLDTDRRGWTILHHACCGAKLTLVKHLVEIYPALLTIRDNNGRTPLHMAGYVGSVEVIDYFANQKCNMLDTDSDGRNILHYACMDQNLTLVKHLVENYPALLTMTDNQGQIPLQIAGYVGSVEVIDYFASQKCNILDTDSNGRTILHFACMKGKLTLIKHLVETYPALLTMRDNNGWTPLHIAGIVDSFEVTDYLISQKIDMLDADSNGRTILHIACMKGKLTLVKHLVENYPALLTMRDNDEQTPVHKAGSVGSVEVIDYFASQKCNILVTDSVDRTILHNACMNENLTLVKHLVENRPTLLTMRDNDGHTPLHLAGFVDSFEVIEYLTSQKIDMLGTDRNGWTILHITCVKGKLTQVKHLVENHQALLTMRDNKGRTPLHIAGFVGSVEVIDYLASQKCNILDADSDGRTILHIACVKGELTLVKPLIENYSAVLTIRDNQGHTPLHIACKNDKLTLVKHLVENYPAALKMTTNDGQTPLHKAGWSGSVELVDYLVNQQCNMLAKDIRGRVTIHHACNSGKLSLVKHLVENYPALLEMKDKKNVSPLHLAGWTNSVKLVQYLTSKGCDVCDKDINCWTILHRACQGGNLALVQYLVENYPALLTMRDTEGQTPLHRAGFSGSIELTEFLISKGCDVLDKDSNCKTVLHFACGKGRLELVKHLFEKYPDLLQVRDTKGLTSLHSAVISGSIEVVDFLFGTTYTILNRTDKGDTILHFACKESNLTIIKHLSEKCPALLTAVDNKGRTPLHKACAYNSVQTVEYLLSRGAELSLKDFRGRTVLDLANIKGNIDVVIHLTNNRE